MPQIVLRLKFGASGPQDLVLNVQDKTFDYLMTSPADEIRISAYLDRDWPQVEAEYEEVFVSEECAFESRITKIIPGSKTRKKIQLPGAMKEGEQLTILVERKPIEPAQP